MPSYSLQMRQLLDRCVLDINIAGLRDEQAVDYIKRKTGGITLTHREIGQRKYRMMRKGITLLERYQKDRYAYKLEVLNIIWEKKYLKDAAHQDFLRYSEKKEDFYRKMNASHRIDELGNSLIELYLLLSQIDSGYGLPTSETDIHEIPQSESFQDYERRQAIF